MGGAELIQRHHREATDKTRIPLLVCGTDYDARQVLIAQLTEFDEQRAPRGTSRRMRRAGRILQIGARWIDAVFVGKLTVEHHNLLALWMRVR